MTDTIRKLRDNFAEMAVYKDLQNTNSLSTLGLPSFTRDWLLQDATEVMRQVRRLHVARTEAQLEALTSFAFNVGIGRLKQSTLLKTIRQGGSKAAIQRQFKRWVYAGGSKLPGLVARRQWEAEHFFEPSYPTDDEIIDRV